MPPADLEYLWNVFCDLTHTRQSGNPISYTEIAAYCQLMNCRVEPWEVKLLIRVDKSVMTKKTGRAIPTSSEGAIVKDVIGDVVENSGRKIIKVKRGQTSG